MQAQGLSRGILARSFPPRALLKGPCLVSQPRTSLILNARKAKNKKKAKIPKDVVVDDEERPLESSVADPTESPSEQEQIAGQPDEEVQSPNYALWIASLLTVIALFYTVVFYVGAGFFYLVSKKVDFRRKDFVPYSETLRLRKLQKEEAEMKRKLEESAAKDAPSVESDIENQTGPIVSEEKIGASDLPTPNGGGDSPL